MKYPIKGKHSTKPIAFFKLKNTTIMKTKKRKIKNVKVETADNVMLDFGDQAETIEEIEIGMFAMVDGEPANGDYTMPDGSVWSFVAAIGGGGLLISKGAPSDMGFKKIVGFRLKGRLQVYAKKKKISRIPGKPAPWFSKLKPRIIPTVKHNIRNYND